MRRPNYPTTGLLYEMVAVKVLELIRERQVKPYEPIPSEADLAKMYGVSRMTAKLALEQLANKGIVYRLPRRGTFLAEGGEATGKHSDASAHLTRSGPGKRGRRLIGIMVPDLDDYTCRIIGAVERETRNHDCELIVKITKNQDDEEECLIQLAEGDGLDGIILFPRGRQTCSDEVLKLKLQRYPIVIIDRIYKEILIDCVHHDHFKGAYQMTKFMIDQGHKEIGFMSIPFSSTSSLEERYQGYIQALLDHSVPIKVHYIKIDFRPKTDLRSDPGAESPELEQFMTENPNLTAVICADDYIAASLMYNAIRLNIPVPERLSISGFSDIQLSSFLPVQLTTVKQTAEQLGQSAVNLLMKRIQSPNESPVCVKINTALVIRKSVGPGRSSR